MDESLNCPIESNIGAFAAGAGVGAALFAAGVGYAAMLIKNKNNKNIKSTSAWLLSPFTSTMNYLRSFCGYNKSGTIDDTRKRESMPLNVVTKPESELETGTCIE